MTPREGLLASIATGTWPDITPWTDVPLDPTLFDDGLHWWQFDLLDEVAALFRAGYRRVLLQCPTGGGKCLGRGTPILMFNGTVKAVEDVRAGDLLMGPDSRPRKVLSTCTGREMLYRVTPKKGDPYVVNESHILSLRLTNGMQCKSANPGRDGGMVDGQIVNIAVKDYVGKSATFKHIAKGWRTGVDFSVQGPLLLDPYFLGIWLGDGNSRGPGVTTIDPEVIDYLRTYAESLGLGVREDASETRCTVYHLTNGKNGGQPNVLRDALRAYDLILNKHIPHSFLTSSREDRLALLAGIIDTDGSLSKNSHYDVTFKSKRLAEDTVFLARSLGFAAYIKSCRKTCTNNGVEGDYWRFSITGDVDQIPVRIPRKKSGPRRQKKNVLNVGITVEPIGEGDYFGFEIDGDRLFLLGDFTVTHNTVMALSALLSARAMGLQAQFLVHRKELLKQTGKRFTSSALDHSFVAADFPFDPAAGLHLSGVQTLIKRLDRVLPPVLVIVDEGHHAVSATYAEILERWPDAFILILTATPERLDGRGLEEHADAMVLGPSPRWLIDNGYLSDYDYYAPDIPDLGSVNPDQNRSATAALLNKPKLVGSLVEHYLQYAKGEQGIVFAQNRDHSRRIAEAFTANGIPAMHVDGDTPTADRDNFDDAFRAGDILIGTNCNLFGEGYDVPGIGYLGIAAATKSLVNHLQWCGRVLRFVPGKRAVICDHAGNALPTQLGGRALGLPDDDREWSLKGRAARQAAAKDWASITQCLECFRVYPSAAPCCPGCAADRPAAPRVVQQTDGKLSKLEREALKKADARRRKEEELACKTYDELVSLAVARGYDWPVQWARRQARFRRIAIPWSQL